MNNNTGFEAIQMFIIVALHSNDDKREVVNMMLGKTVSQPGIPSRVGGGRGGEYQ